MIEKCKINEAAFKCPTSIEPDDFRIMEGKEPTFLE